MWTLSNQEQSIDSHRCTIMVVVVLIHVGGAIAFVAALRDASRRASDPASALRFLLIELPTPRQVQASDAASIASASNLEAITTVPLALNSTAPTQDVSGIDFDTERAQSAANVVRNAEQPTQRSLDSRPRFSIPKPEKYEPGLFDRGPAHKPGTVDDLGEGIFRTWVSHYCYVISGMGPLDREEVGRCQSTGVDRNAAFDEFMPRYLRQPDSDQQAPASKRGDD